MRATPEVALSWADREYVAHHEPSQPTGRQLPQTRWIVLATMGCFVALAIPFAHADAILTTHIRMPLIIGTSLVECFVAYLLTQLYLSSGRIRLLATAAAFGFATITTFAYRLMLEGTRSTSHAATMWSIRNIGFATIMSCAYVIPRINNSFEWSLHRRRQRVLTTILSTFALCAACVLGVIITTENASTSAAFKVAPSWISSPSTSTQTILIAMMLAASTTSLVATLRQNNRTNVVTNGNTNGIEAWMPIATGGSLACALLSLAGNTIPSLGWQSGELAILVTNTLVLTAILSELLRLYRKAESDREYLEYQAATLLQATREATDREERIRRIIKNAADPYIEIDRTGNIQAWNEKAEEVFGLDPHSSAGTSLARAIMPPEGEHELDELINAFWDDEDRFDGVHAELLARDVNNDEFPVETTIWVDESNVQPQMNFFFRDIALHKQAEHALQESLRGEREALLQLQELDRTRSNFVSSISHELRSPLTSALGYLEELREGGAGPLTQEQLRMVEIAHRNTNRLFQLIKDLLTISQIENGSFNVNFRAVDLGTVIQTTVDHFMHLAQERDISLTYESGFDLGACPGDREQIERALSCVISNAVKFTPPGGRVDVVAEAHDNTIAIVVTDNGVGIAPSEQTKLFQRFYRSAQAIEDQSQGAGLGLTIAQAIIERHNGEIFVESTLGKGTTITIILPATFLTNRHANKDMAVNERFPLS